MFYLANAYIYCKGYKINSINVHQTTINTLKEFSKEISQELVKEYELEIQKALNITQNLNQNFLQKKRKRSNFQYETTEKIKYAKAQTSLNRAKEFSEKILNLI